MELEKFQIGGLEFTKSTIINFSSLNELLSIIVQKCNYLDTKYNILDVEMNEKEKRLSNVETSLNINNDQTKYIVNSPIKTHNKENSSVETTDIVINKEEKEYSNEKSKEKIELNYTMFSELYKKMKDHDKSIKNIVNTLNINKKIDEERNNEIKKNNDNINSKFNSEFKKVNTFIDKVNEKIEEYDADLDELKEKLKDFNLYELFKFQNLGSDIDQDFLKNVISNLESKMNKKYMIYDEKIKLINTEIFKLQEDQRNDNGLLDSSIERMKKLKEELNQKYNNLSSLLTNNINDIIKKIDFIESEINLIDYNITTNNNEEKKKEYKENENKDKEKKSSKNVFPNSNNNASNGINASRRSFLYAENIRKLVESLNNLEKYCKNNFDQINQKEIEKRLLSLENNNKNYSLYEKELNNFSNKINVQDIKSKENIGKLDIMVQDIELYKTEIKHLMRKVDSISFEISKFTGRDFNPLNEPKSNTIDANIANKFISASIFNDNKKENVLKFDKINKRIEELELNIDSIVNKLSHTPNDTDFYQFQEIIKNMIENIIIKNKKQFANKLETVKSYKLLETKLNTINDTYNKKASGADNWLLAKKPLNIYQCASCESIIKGDLDQKSDYIAWNKYPYREENKSSYRMGHGFSHMLHMINEGLMKDTGESIKDEENKKVKKEENVVNDKNKKNNEDLSMENLLNLPKLKKKSNIYDLSIGFDSPINKSRDLKQINKTNDNQENTPQIIRILKKNRSSIFKTVVNNAPTEKPKKIENIKYINFTINNKE